MQGKLEIAFPTISSNEMGDAGAFCLDMKMCLFTTTF